MGNMEELYKVFQEELNIACSSFYTWKNIRNIAAGDKKVHRALNRTPLSWNIILISLQSTFFITIGRLFDKDKRSFSVHMFLRKCIENVDQFSKDALRKRKIEGSEADKPSWLDEYWKNLISQTKKIF